MAVVKLLKRYQGSNILQSVDSSADTFEIKQIDLKATSGTAPLLVQSNTVVTNLNADLLDGYHASDFSLTGHTHSSLHDQNTDTGTDQVSFHIDSGSSGPRIKNESGVLAIRNSADNSYSAIRCSELLIDGDITRVNSTTLDIGDNLIVLNKDVTGAPSEDAGIEIERGTSLNFQLLWNETTDRLQAGEIGSLQNVILANSTDLDSRYFTESELNSGAASSGSDLIGDDDTYSYFTPTAATIKGALEGIDTALSISSGVKLAVEYTAGAGGVTAGDLVYVSSNDTVLKSDASGIATAAPTIGIALTTESVSSPVMVATSGLVEGVGSGWTAGEIIYLSPTAGLLTNSAPTSTGEVVLEVGIAKNATDLQLNIKTAIIN